VPSGATEAQVEAAVEAGELAVSALLERYPDDALAHLAAARMAKKAKDPATTLDALEKALELDPDIRTNAHVASLLWWAVQKHETESRALKLLKGPMKARGADILYDLAVTDGISKNLARLARSSLSTHTFRRESTPAAAAAASLLLAPRCEQRKALVKLAENVGDERSARLLRVFRDGKGCAAEEPAPCNACLDPKAVQAALDAIEIRAAKKDAPPDKASR
jgi:tetratricopeptide (TPR) repeat protein